MLLTRKHGYKQIYEHRRPVAKGRGKGVGAAEAVKRPPSPGAKRSLFRRLFER